MPDVLVKPGDIIRIKKGMIVRTRVPVKFFNNAKPFSQGAENASVVVGKIYKNSPYSREKVYKMLDLFLGSEFNVFLSEETLTKFVNDLPIDYEVKTFDTSYLEGEYVVFEALYLEKRIVTYQVFCYKKDNPDIKITFNQKGPGYKTVNKDIEVIGNIDQEVR